MRVLAFGFPGLRCVEKLRPRRTGCGLAVAKHQFVEPKAGDESLSPRQCPEVRSNLRVPRVADPFRMLFGAKNCRLGTKVYHRGSVRK